MGRVQGKVALLIGAARCQGRSHAVRTAQEGADVIAVDVCRRVDTVPHPTATSEDLAGTVSQAEAPDRHVIATEADVRDPAALTGGRRRDLPVDAGHMLLPGVHPAPVQ